MKVVNVNLAGRERYLAFTVEAMFQVQEQFGGSSELLEAMGGSGRDGVSAICKAAAILTEQGELVRRSLGYDPEPMVDAEALMVTMTPADVIALRMAIPAALSLGYGREVEPENDEVDLYMAELSEQKKTR